jgi:murein L,D-transpeptidase YafK
MKRLFLRIPLYIVVLLSGIYLSENLVPQFDGRKDLPPDADTIIARNALDISFRHGARDYFLSEFDSVEYELELARKAVNTELGQQWFTRDFTYSSQKLATAQDDVNSLLVKTSRKESADREQSGEKLSSLKDILDQSKALLEHTSISIIARQRYTRADLLYKNAKDLYARKKYQSALHLADQGVRTAKSAMETSRAILSRYSDPSLLNRWIAWKNSAVEASRRTGTAIVVIKERHRLDFYRNGSLARTFEAELGANSVNQKIYAGDRATPEGYYTVTQKKGYGQSKYGCALLINYPNNEDRQRFQSLKSKNELGRGSRIGGLIEIHGSGGRGFDWTDGCVALTDNEIEWLYKAAAVGTNVAIIGSDGNGGPISSTLRNLTKK